MINSFFTSNKEKVNAKQKDECNFRLQFDGCSKSNPGLAGAGAVIYNLTNDELWFGSEFIGTKITNNYAEYMGLIIGLKQAKEMKIKQKELTNLGKKMIEKKETYKNYNEFKERFKDVFM